MPRLVLAVAALVALNVIPSAQGQTYDPGAPVCMHVFGELEGERMDCVFTSMDQCRASARGRPAMCLANPYFVSASRPPPKPRRRLP